MIHAGDTIENPVTGERIVFRQTSRETNGQAVVIETFVQPNGFVAAAHVHPSQEERFEILRGSVGFRIGRKKLPIACVLVPSRKKKTTRITSGRNESLTLDSSSTQSPVRLPGIPPLRTSTVPPPDREGPALSCLSSSSGKMADASSTPAPKVNESPRTSTRFTPGAFVAG